MIRYYKDFKIVKTELKQTHNGKDVIKYLYKVFRPSGYYDVYLSQYTLKETKEYIDKFLTNEELTVNL